MADTGEKFYVAKSSSAEEILNMVDNFSVDGIEAVPSYGYGDFVDVIEGSIYGSTSVADVVITGKGWALVDFQDNNGSEIFDAMEIDGVVCYITVLDSDTRPVFLPFNESITFKDMYYAAYHNVSYKIFLYD